MTALARDPAPPPSRRRRATLYTLENDLAYGDDLPRQGGAIRADFDGRWIAYDDGQRLGEVLETHFTEEHTAGGWVDIVHVYYDPSSTPAVRPRLVASHTTSPPEVLLCWYDRHRPTDWTPTAGGAVTCGVCHPPARGLVIVRRGEPGFAELEVAAAMRMTGRRPRCDCSAVLSSEEAVKRGTCADCNRIEQTKR